VRSAECIGGRHLLEQTVGTVAKALEWKGNVGRCENLAQLVVELGRLLETWTDTEQNKGRRLALVFDGIDNQRDAPPTLLPALARLGEVVSCGRKMPPRALTHDIYRSPTSPPFLSSLPLDRISCILLVLRRSIFLLTRRMNF
jgi:hypothetical protein